MERQVHPEGAEEAEAGEQPLGGCVAVGDRRAHVGDTCRGERAQRFGDGRSPDAAALLRRGGGDRVDVVMLIDDDDQRHGDQLHAVEDHEGARPDDVCEVVVDRVEGRFVVLALVVDRSAVCGQQQLGGGDPITAFDQSDSQRAERRGGGFDHQREPVLAAGSFGRHRLHAAERGAQLGVYGLVDEVRSVGAGGPRQRRGGGEPLDEAMEEEPDEANRGLLAERAQGDPAAARRVEAGEPEAALHTLVHHHAIAAGGIHHPREFTGRGEDPGAERCRRHDIERPGEAVLRDHLPGGRGDQGESCRGLPQALCLLYTSPSPRDRTRSRMPSSA